MIPVFVEPVGEDFSGDIPEGLVAVVAQPARNGFSDGGDIAVYVQPAPAGFSDGGDVPEGLLAVYARPAGAGFSDGGDRPPGWSRSDGTRPRRAPLIPPRLGASRASSPQP